MLSKTVDGIVGGLYFHIRMNMTRLSTFSQGSYFYSINFISWYYANCVVRWHNTVQYSAQLLARPQLDWFW